MRSEHFTESQVTEIGYQIAVALEFCHTQNILHQDMKPMNGMLTKTHTVCDLLTIFSVVARSLEPVDPA